MFVLSVYICNQDRLNQHTLFVFVHMIKLSQLNEPSITFTVYDDIFQFSDEKAAREQVCEQSESRRVAISEASLLAIQKSKEYDSLQTASKTQSS